MRKRRSLTLAACCGVHSLQDGLTDLLYVLLPILAGSFGLTYLQVGVVRAANRSALTLFEIPSGMLSERAGERALLAFGLVCAGAGYLLLAVADSFVAILLCLFLAGLGAAFQHTLSSTVISRTYSSTGRRAALGVYNSCGDIGKLAITGLFTLLIGIGAAWQGVTTGLGLAALLAAATLFAVLSYVNVGDRPAAHAAAETDAESLGWGIRNPGGFAVLAAIVFLDIAVQAGFLTFLAFLLIEKQVPTGLAAFAVVLTLSGGVFGKFACGFLAQRLGVVRSLVLAQCLTAAGIVAVLLSPTSIAFLLLPLLGAALQGSSSITYGTVVDLVDERRRSRGFSVTYSIASGATIVSPIVFGLIGDHFGLMPAMLAMACTVLLTLPLCAPLSRALEESEPPIYDASASS